MEITMKKCLSAALVALLVLTAGCFNNSDVELVKNGSFTGYPTTTVGKILDSNFEKINSKGNGIWDYTKVTLDKDNFNLEDINKEIKNMFNEINEEASHSSLGGYNISYDFSLESDNLIEEYDRIQEIISKLALKQVCRKKLFTHLQPLKKPQHLVILNWVFYHPKNTN